jgi:hypothetical protein
VNFMNPVNPVNPGNPVMELRAGTPCPNPEGYRGIFRCCRRTYDDRGTGNNGPDLPPFVKPPTPPPARNPVERLGMS